MSGFVKYFLIPFVLLAAAVAMVAGKQGKFSRKPPLELFPDMDRQPKLRPQAYNSFFGDGLSSRKPIEGTVAHSKPVKVGEEEVYLHQEHPLTTGRVTGTTNWVETNPFPITEKVMARGQERFNISCTPCHGALGDGNGITKKIGAMAVVANLHDPRIVAMPDGEIFNIITYGKSLMMGYGSNVTPEDRWAIIAYLRALQRSHLGYEEDVPAEMHSKLPGLTPAGAKQEAKK